MYMYTSTAISLLLCLYFIPSMSCLNNETITWSKDPASSKFTGMLLSEYGGQVIVSGTNKVYNINASNLMLLNNDTTGPYNASSDDTVKLMVYNQSYNGPEYVTTCSSTHNYCSIRNLDNVLHVEWQLQKHVRNISGVQAFLVDSAHGSERDSYLFVGCPHSKDQEWLEGLCKSPGIFWYRNSGDEENDGDNKQSFKSYDDTPVKTEKYVAAFAVEKLRLFFSIQKQLDGTKISRVAQVCQYYDNISTKYTTPITYVDMPIKCGDFQEVSDVKKVSVDDNTILVAVFTDGSKSAICVYNMSQVNKTFVDNMKVCYETHVIPRSDEYYFKHAEEQEPCRKILLQLSKANTLYTHGSFLDLDMSIDNEIITTRKYDKRDDYDYENINWLSLDGNIPKCPSYGIYLSQRLYGFKGVIVIYRTLKSVAFYLQNITETLTDENYLCNTLYLRTFHHMIGTHELTQDPVIIFNKTVTAVTTSTENSTVIVFLGTSDGTIFKATVYPKASVGIIKQPYTYNYGNIKNMLTSHDEKHIYVLTDYKLYKRPVESCSSFVSCGDCIASLDPYCGWCMLENRCSKHSMCSGSYVWIPAFYTSQCPSVLDIHPNLISERDNNKLSINVSNRIQTSSRSCVFYNERFSRNYTVSASILNDGNTVECRMDFISEERPAIKGTINVSVSITTPRSASPIMTGYFSVYNCETFNSCNQCADKKLSCMWDTYDVKCLYNTSSSTGHELVRKLEMCPRAVHYTIQGRTDDPRQKSENDSWYLSKNGVYELSMMGTNLPETGAVGFSCLLSIGSSQRIEVNGTRVQSNNVACVIKTDVYQVLDFDGEHNATIRFMWGSSEIEGEPFKAVVYECESLSEASDNCGLCKSFATSQPHYHCKWCESSCIYSQNYCYETDIQCPNPEITKVYPLSVAVNATVQVEIEGKNLGSVFEDTIAAVTIAGKPCQSIEALYDPARRIVCNLERSSKPRDAGRVNISLTNGATGEYSEPFTFRIPVINAIEPKFGPNDGGTLITLTGEYLDTGAGRQIIVGGMNCSMSEANSEIDTSGTLVCSTYSLGTDEGNTTVNVSVEFDGTIIYGGDNVNFTYVTNPKITNIYPLKSFESGGIKLTVSGTNLHAIQRPRIYAVIDGTKTKYEDCVRGDNKTLNCPSPSYDDDLATPADHDRAMRQINTGKEAKLGFIMDDVSSVRADNLPVDIAVIVYYPDPVIYNLTKTKELREIQDGNLVIKGNNLDVAASKEDVKVMIGCIECTITEFTPETILCDAPSIIPQCISANHNILTVQVHIGYYKRSVGEIKYESMKQPSSTEKIIIISVIGLLVISLMIAGIYVWIMKKKKGKMKREIVIKLDKLEANFRNQCREEFANLQTAVSDLTTDLEGGNVLFREYSMYADKTLFTSQKTEALRHPPTEYPGQVEKSMDMFKGLLLNTQFLLLFIKTLEKQKPFTIIDKSNVATILMTMNHDNMEYITGILLSLLSDLVDKSVISGTPKLMLRRSESVGEKLLTHWLSICMYHDLKGQTGSALFILYKAMKIQTEKGPIDYMTNCGKYTLSEAKLFTFGDRDIKPVTLTLQVNHFDYIDNQEKQIQVSVLDCDTISQAKSKMLEILYKNVPYSQRPSVHSTTLAVENKFLGTNFCEEVEEDDGGTKRLMHDEDASSVKEGVWKRINTLQHYTIKDGAVVYLYLNRDMEMTCKSLGDVSPDSYIVGTLQKAKPAVKTVSDSNFWHLTKNHQSDDEAPPASDLFLPRLTTTKMTIQPYIEQLFTAVLSVEDEPSIIIKYLFDFLDMEASKSEVTDPDIVHTWKCNSLLLRFWVNIIKNPEIVFDVHKPILVDSCLSVVAQTLMDSCSTADLVLSKNSPSNKLLFAKDIPRYKTMVRDYFQGMKEKPAVSDQDLNSYLTQKVSQKFSGMFHTQSALIELYNYAASYKTELCVEMENLEASSPGSFSSLSSKLKSIFMCMEKK